jgi:hypothetical protein
LQRKRASGVKAHGSRSKRHGYREGRARRRRVFARKLVHYMWSPHRWVTCAI